MTLTKAALVKQLMQHVEDLDKKTTVLLVNAFFETLITSLEKDDAVSLPGFGVFRLKDKKARPGRNPRTGEAKIIMARKVLMFKPSQKLKAQVRCLKKLKSQL